jgi:monofunctional biosynthetic peptidoglycan transglycosylase
MSKIDMPDNLPRIFVSKSHRVWRTFKYVVLSILVSSIVMVLLLRIVPPLLSMVMLENEISSWFDHDDHDLQYKWVSLNKMSPLVGVAVIAAEDQTFADHFGFDWKAISKAINYNEKHRKTKGASTISQQTAKNLFLWEGRNWVRKGCEVYFTLLIEALWSKERILEVYLNIIELGDGVYGVEAASQKYFHKSAQHITAQEAALLAAVLPNPHHFSVAAPSAYVRGRQAWILGQMQHLGGQHYLDNL